MPVYTTRTETGEEKSLRFEYRDGKLWAISQVGEGPAQEYTCEQTACADWLKTHGVPRQHYHEE